MLTRLRVQNFALIEDVTLNFNDRLIVLSGETGSGKSILINAINFLIGDRADKTFLRYGTNFTQVNGVFKVTDQKEIIAECNNLGIENDEELIISRKLTADGKSEIRVNGVLVNLCMLKRITTLLVDIYGQHQHQSLLDIEKHISFIDAYREPPQLFELHKIIDEIKQIDDKLQMFGGDASAREREKGMLEFELKELNEAELQLGEDAELEEKRKKFANVQRVVEAINGATGYLSENENSGSISGSLYNANKMLSGVIVTDNKLNDLSTRLESARIEVEDIRESLEQVLEEYDFSENEREQVEDRWEVLKNIKRKYGGSIESALEYQKTAEKKIDFLCNSEEQINQLTSQKDLLTKQGWELCNEIRKIRKQNSSEIEQKIVKELTQLGMPNAKLIVDFQETEHFTLSGADKVEFMFSANAGEPLKPLVKVISGGEMSRFMLAFKTVMSNVHSVPMMIFDEIDSGIGGEVGFAVACKMVEISKKAQVIVVTHLASIGAMADQHFQIEKKKINDRTVTEITELNTEQQLNEIARLAGGYNGDFATEYAQQLKNRANQLKS